MTDVDQQLPPPPAAANATTTAPAGGAGVRKKPARQWRRFRLPWIRARLTRQSVTEWFKTMVWVVPLTIIIWIYAEREQVPQLPYPIDHVSVQVISTAPDIFLEVSSDPARFVYTPGTPVPQVSLKLTGPQEGLEKVRDELNSIPPEMLRIDVGNTLRPSLVPQRLNVVNSVRNYPIFRKNGVSVLDSSPAELLVLVDDVQEVPVDVQLPRGLMNVDVAASTIDPRGTRLRGPARLLRGVSVYSDLPKSVASLRPGLHTLNDVPLVLDPPDDRITFVPPRKVNVRLMVLAADETYTLPNAVPVYIEEPQTLQQSYDIKWDPSLTDVKVIGSHERIEQLRQQEQASGGSTVRAVLELSTDDIGHSPKAVTFTLPEGLRISPESAGRMVAFTLTPRGG
jgi:hypothetical protein